jgi:Zn-dependent peptidase ImmA (M78 family)
MAPRFSLARRRADDLLRRGRVRRAPVPVEKLAALLGARIVLQPFSEEFSGMVHRNRDGSAVIGINSSDSMHRQRFTIAHEIGHLLLHTDENLHVDKNFPIGLRNEISGKSVDENEIEANQFAAALLMPLKLIEIDIEPFIGKDDVLFVIHKLAAKYRVSEQAMSIRLSSLGYVKLGT